ncbi:MAG: PBP1A family penicillin-binding protein [Proteobacteria bacterium]|nr:PBP1A family penicillin-binding protein [Pseudomonadota bacterium]
MAFSQFGRFRILLFAGASLAFVAGAGAVWFYVSFMRGLPELRSVADYQPPVTSRVVDRNGLLIGEFYVERRQVVPLAEIPKLTQLAFLAAEDSQFYEHAGVDYVSILRAAWVNVREGGVAQGASTITMQLVKRLLLTPERRLRRKIREVILARRIEDRFTKDEILFLYLNQIYFGNGAYGIAEAARTFFDKSPADLTISESAMLAGLPQRPSAYAPYTNYEEADRRRRYVLGRMLADEFIDEATYEAELANPPELIPPAERERLAAAAYFTEEVRRYLFDRFGGELVLNGGLVIETTLDLERQVAADAALRRGLNAHDHRQGLRERLGRLDAADIPARLETLVLENELVPPPPEEAEATEETAAEPEPEAPEETEIAAAPETEAEASADDESAEESDAVELPFDQPLVGVVTAVDREADTARVAFGPEHEGIAHLDDVNWAREPDPSVPSRPVKRIDQIFRVGDMARFVRLPDLPVEPEAQAEVEEGEAAPPVPPRLDLYQEPIVQGALVSLDVTTGDVLALVGGYDFEKSQFNRATQARRQPGSSFKPFIYGAALAQEYTPVTELLDTSIVYRDPVSGFEWKPQNYGRKFYGPIPLRTALVRSINSATVHLFRDVGVDFVIDYARRLGIQSPLSRDLSLALGSSGVTLLELTTAYSVFPNEGRRVVPRFIQRVTDRNGELLLEDVPLGTPPPPVLKPLVVADEEIDVAAAYPDADILPTDEVVTPAAAYLMTDLLKAVVFDPRGTGWRLRRLKRPIAGKTGTTNEQADAWFMGFSPEIATGVWVGHDESRVLGKGETGSSAAAPIWVEYMEHALADVPVRDFPEPEGIVYQRIDRKTGLLAEASTAESYFQPFLEGTEPTQSSHRASASSETRRLLRMDPF